MDNTAQPINIITAYVTLLCLYFGACAACLGRAKWGRNLFGKESKVITRDQRSRSGVRRRYGLHPRNASEGRQDHTRRNPTPERRPPTATDSPRPAVNFFAGWRLHQIPKTFFPLVSLSPLRLKLDMPMSALLALKIYWIN
jgi:hypothetical protein